MKLRLVLFGLMFFATFSVAAITVKNEYNEEIMGISGNFSGDTVIIDAGHGGEDGGAVGIDGILEKEINLSISEKANALLGFYGVNTKMTRSEDISLHTEESKRQGKRKLSDAQNRVKQITDTPNAVLISIHQNSFPDESCKGAQVFFAKNNILSHPLAECVLDSIQNGLNDKNKRVVKQAEDRIYLLKNINCPAVLVECGFITNSKESKLLMTEKYRLKLAACIVSGYVNYKNEKGTGAMI